MHEVGPFWRRQLIRLSAVLAGAMNTSPVAETPAPYEPPEEF